MSSDASRVKFSQDASCCRYVPNAQLTFEYPDDSYSQLCAATPLGADGNLLMRDDPMSQVLHLMHPCWTDVPKPAP